MALLFEWDTKKAAAANSRKHGVAFAEATTDFGDPLSVNIDDPDHSSDEARFIILGMSVRRRVLVVVHTASGDRVRLRQPETREERMKRTSSRPTKRSDMRPEYEFSGGDRGKYAEQYRSGTNVVFLEPDVAEAFPDADSVNEALRALLAVARRADSGKRA